VITQVRAAVSGLVSLVVLMFVLGALPWVLYRFGGSPFPSHIVGWHRIAALISSRDDGTLLLGLVRICSWLAWLLFTTCVLAEVQALMRRRRPPRLRLGGFQGAAAHLVALSALAFATPVGTGLSASLTALGEQPTLPVTPSNLSGDEPVAMAALNVEATAPSTVVVRAGDCLWSLAQRYLGGGDRYPEIVTLNYGHDMGQGQVFTDPSLIQPGWRLLLPGGANVGRDDFGRAGANHLGHRTTDTASRRRHAAARNRVPQIGNTGSRSHIAQEESNRSLAELSPGEARSQSADRGTGQPGFGAHAEHTEVTSAAIFVSGALAGAVLTSLGRMRHRQRQERRRGRRIPLPEDARALATEQRLRASKPTQQLGTLREALASLELGILRTSQQLPDVVGLHVTPDVLEVLLAQPSADGPPAPFLISPGRQGMCWKLDLPAFASSLSGIAGRAQGQSHFLPGLITAGATEEGYLLIDLESIQVMACDGPDSLVSDVVATIAVELATCQWSGSYDLLLVGCDEMEGAGAESCATLDAALDLLQARCAALASRIADRAPRSIRELRLAEPDNEDWGVTILVSRLVPTPAHMTRLLQLAQDGPGGIAVVVAGDVESADGRMSPTVLQVAPDPRVMGGVVANLVPLQITLCPSAMSAADYEAIAALFSSAATLDDVHAHQAPYAPYAAGACMPMAARVPAHPVSDGPSRAGEDDASVRLRSVQDHLDRSASAGEDNAAVDVPVPAMGIGSRLDVRILGPFTITGAAEPLQPKQAELVLALALAAPAGLTNSALCSVLGADPDHPKPADSVRQIITRTRRRLGLAADGQEYILHTGNGQYILHPEVALDWSSFRQLVATGHVDDLRAAISLITGQPFAGSYFWWIDIPLSETVRAELVDACETLAESEFAMGSPRAAAWAARAGLRADISAEQLWRAVMRAEHAVGNLAGVAEAWRRCLDAIDDVAPGGEPHPDTASLYRKLTVPDRQRAPVR
jgi:DNA-binding SARP family transcriptional activator